MRSSLPLRRLAVLPLALLSVALAGCPDVTQNGGGGGDAGPLGPVGKLKLVQTIVASDDPDVTDIWDFLVSPNGEKVYATSWHGQLITFDRSPVNGSLARAYAKALFNGAGIAITPDGEHLYAIGSNNPDQLARYDIDPVTGEPAQKSSLHVRGRELVIANHGSLLFESSGGDGGAGILSYHVDPTSGALAPGATTPHDSPVSNFMFLADDETGTLYAERVVSGGPKYIVRYTVDPGTGALAKEAETLADLWWGYVPLAKCSGTTRMYVPQQKGNIGYADTSGHGLSIPSSFTHPDLVYVRSATLSPDCKNLYAVTQQNSTGAVVVLARDDAGDLSWLQTIPMGPGAPLFAITEPLYAGVSPDGKNVYLSSTTPGQGFAVFARDTTGAGL